MAALKNKLQNALDEGRILLLGAQVFIGFHYRSVFDSGFAHLPSTSQYLRLGALGLMLLTLALLLAPATYHQMVEAGEDTEELLHFTTTLMGWALLPFAVSVGVDLFIATEKVTNSVLGIWVGLTSTGVAGWCWYGPAVLRQRRRVRIHQEQPMEQQSPPKKGETDLTEKIRHVLTEARMVLPGAQALLGFQFATMLTEGFEHLPTSSQVLHLGCLALVTLSTVLLMTPAAYHRLVEQGEETPHFYRVASRLVVAALVPLALGLSGDFFVVVYKVTASQGVALTGALVVLGCCYGLWFALPVLRRH